MPPGTLASPVDFGAAAAAVPLAGVDLAAPAVSAASEGFMDSMSLVQRTGDQWFRGATEAERAETFRAWVKRSGGSKSLLQMLEGESGEKLLRSSPNKIPRAVLAAAGSARSKATFSRLHQMMRNVKAGGASPKEVQRLFELSLKEGQKAGFSANTLDAMRRMGPERVYRRGAVNVARVYDKLTKDSAARRLLRWGLGGAGAKAGKVGAWMAGEGQNLTKDVRAQLDAMDSVAKEAGVKERIGQAKGVVGKTKAGVSAVTGKARGLLKGAAPIAGEAGIAAELGAVGAKGVGALSKLGRAAGSVGGLVGGAFIAKDMYDSLIGKSKRARAMMDAAREGATPSVSRELMLDILDKRADLQARRAQLAQNPDIMQSMMQAIGGNRPKTLTGSEAGFGVDTGPSGMSADEMEERLNQVLGQMRGR